MKNILLLLAFACGATAIHAQSREFLQLSPTFTLKTDQLHQSVGGHVCIGGNLGHGLFLGGGVDVYEFNGLDQPYIPVFGNITIMPMERAGKVAMYATVQPGYGIYNNQTKVGNIGIETRGGFYFYGGLGIATPPVKKTGLFIEAGVSSINFTVTGSNQQPDPAMAFTLRAGLMLH